MSDQLLIEEVVVKDKTGTRILITLAADIENPDNATITLEDIDNPSAQDALFEEIQLSRRSAQKIGKWFDEYTNLARIQV